MQPSSRTSAPVTASTSSPVEFFRLPARGPDPYFGLSRSYYYSLEKAGAIRMVRLRTPGAIRGAVLVPAAAVREHIAKQSLAAS